LAPLYIAPSPRPRRGPPAPPRSGVPMPVDILAFGPHPDDAEIACGGLLRKLKDLGRTTGIIDMTSGDMG